MQYTGYRDAVKSNENQNTTAEYAWDPFKNLKKKHVW